MLLYLLQNQLLMLFPVKDFSCRYILGPVAPIKDEDGDGGLVVGKSGEEVALEEAIIGCGARGRMR